MKKALLYLFLAGWILGMNLTVTAAEKSAALPIRVKVGKNIESFIPAGWKLIKKTGGDLNQDGLDDIAGVIEYGKTDSKDSQAPPRVLFIAFKDKGNYQLSVQTAKAILKADQGGVWGDPFEDILVNRGSLLINFYGGSNYRWAYRYRFRYQNYGWYLIGARIDSYFTGTGEGTTEDYNLLTGWMTVTTVDKSGKIQTKTIRRGKKALLNLKDFDALAISEGRREF